MLSWIRSRALCRVAFLGLTLDFAANPTQARAQGATSRQAAPAVGPCCTPLQVRHVEARLPIHPVNPAFVVRYVAHLTLVSVGLLPNQANASIHRPSGPNTIQYTFGYVPPSTGNLYVHQRPRFVQVIEVVEQRRASGISITPVLGGADANAIPPGYYSPLVLVVSQPQRHLTFFIESNIPRNRLRLLGQLLTDVGRAPGTIVPLQAMTLRETKSIEPYRYPQVVAVSGYLRVQRWKPSDPRMYGFLFGNGTVPVGAEYNSHWVTYGGLLLGISARLFHVYLGLPASHPPIAWHGTLWCSGAYSRLHVEWFDMPLPTAGG